MAKPPRRIKSPAKPKPPSGAAKRQKPEALMKLQWDPETEDRFFRANAESLDENAKRVFGRLKADYRVPEALAAIAKSENALNSLLTGCLESAELSRTFSETLNKERGIIVRANRLKLNVDELETFLNEEIWSYDETTGKIVKTSKSINRLATFGALSNREFEKINLALNVLKKIIAGRQRVASETIFRFGATRKSARTNKNAAQTAAIGWLAEAVERIAGRPLTRHAAVLAEATLAIRDITEDRVREALRTRRREWRADR